MFIVELVGSGRQPALSREAFLGYFRGKPKVAGIAESSVVYHNSDTGAFFVLDYVEADSGRFPALLDDDLRETLSDEAIPLLKSLERRREQAREEAEGDEPVGPRVITGFEFILPRAFVLEAAYEMADLAKRFDLRLRTDGNHTPRAFSIDEVVEEWAEASIPNLLDGFRRAFKEELRRFSFLPQDYLEACWRWNDNRASWREREEEFWVPSVVPIRYLKQVGMGFLWPSAVPCIVPEVDFCILDRGDPFASQSRPGDQVAMHFFGLRRVLKPYLREEGVLPHYRVHYESIPRKVERLFGRERFFKTSFQALQHRNVLERERVRAAKELEKKLAKEAEEAPGSDVEC